MHLQIQFATTDKDSMVLCTAATKRIKQPRRKETLPSKFAHTISQGAWCRELTLCVLSRSCAWISGLFRCRRNKDASPGCWLPLPTGSVTLNSRASRKMVGAAHNVRSAGWVEKNGTFWRDCRLFSPFQSGGQSGYWKKMCAFSTGAHDLSLPPSTTLMAALTNCSA